MADKEHASAQCKYHDVCGRDVEGDPADGLCILHSTDATKDADAFTKALAAHREHNGPVSSNGPETYAKQLVLSYAFDLWRVFQQCC